ncbi:hypothetical protein ACFPCZ_21455, partial [Streptomonospora arabica]
RNNLDILTNTPPPRIDTDPPPVKPDPEPIPDPIPDPPMPKPETIPQPVPEPRTPEPETFPTPDPDTAKNLNADLAAAFNKHHGDLTGAYTPNQVHTPFDRPTTATQLRDDLTDVFTKHLADTIGTQAAKNAAHAYTDALIRNWGKNTLNDDLAKALSDTGIPPHLRTHLTRTVPDTLTHNLGAYLANPHMRAQILAMAAATGAFEGYIGEGTTNALLTDEGFKAHGYSATAGASQAGIQNI